MYLNINTSNGNTSVDILFYAFAGSISLLASDNSSSNCLLACCLCCVSTGKNNYSYNVML